MSFLRLYLIIVELQGHTRAVKVWLEKKLTVAGLSPDFTTRR
jgi:hypothetical protein